ncbi:MAG TPA: DUF881 domain-containing protein [Chloroflexia bacterium]|nr:DUF881 domain-containing protein [Chloroflexia bacterium]
MKTWRARVLVSAVCLVLGILLVSQFRSQRIDRSVISQSPNDQTSYLSQLYTSNEQQRASLEQLQAEVAKYEQTRNGGSSSLLALIKDLQQLRMINGEVEVTGPGVEVRVTGGENVVQMIQDLVNELRNAGAEAVAVNGVRLVSRSVIEEDADHHLTVDKQPITSPYRLDAIGDAATLQTALERKGGVIALLQQQEQSVKLEIKVVKHSEDGDLIKLPKTTLDARWRYAHPAPPPGN